MRLDWGGRCGRRLRCNAWNVPPTWDPPWPHNDQAAGESAGVLPRACSSIAAISIQRGAELMGQDTELAELRARVDCRVVLERAGWTMDRRESTRRATKYRHGAGQIVIVTHEGRGWFDPLAEAARGDVIALAQRLWGGTLGHARKALRPLAGIVPVLPPETPRAARPPVDCQEAWFRRAPPRPGSAAWHYLTEVRGLPPDLLTRLGNEGTIREGYGGTAWFLHRVQGAPCGWEMRGPAYKGFASGGRKTLFVLAESSSPEVVMVCESAIDALSLAILDGFDPLTAYVSTGGGWGDGGRDAILQLACGGDLLVAATDQGLAGEKLAARLELLAKHAGASFQRRVPDAKDWNDYLMDTLSG